MPPNYHNSQVSQIYILQHLRYQKEEIFEATQPVMEWYVNFADYNLFGFYGGSLFAQDEMMVR